MVGTQFQYVVVPIYLIEEKYPGGIEKLLEEYKGYGGMWFDDYLFVLTQMGGCLLDSFNDKLSKYDIKNKIRGVYDRENVNEIHPHQYDLKYSKKITIPIELREKMKRLVSEYGMIPDYDPMVEEYLQESLNYENSYENLQKNRKRPRTNSNSNLKIIIWTIIILAILYKWISRF